jgi:peptidoglycan DL-endopeptidase CwlO
VLSAREAQALREALALRSSLAGGQPLTPAQAAALRTATAAAVRTAPGTTRTTARPPARRSTTGRPAARRPASRGTAPRTAPRRRKPGRPSARTGSRWSTRLGVVALSTLLLPAVAALVLPAADETGAGNGALDTTALALTAQSSLLEDAGRYRQLQQEVDRRKAELQQARDAEQAAAAQVVVQQQTVGSTAAELYRAAPSSVTPCCRSASTTRPARPAPSTPSRWPSAPTSP